MQDCPDLVRQRHLGERLLNQFEGVRHVISLRMVSAAYPDMKRTLKPGRPGEAG
jgi:hypothetical protein